MFNLRRIRLEVPLMVNLQVCWNIPVPKLYFQIKQIDQQTRFVTYRIWAMVWDFQKCGICDQQSRRSACAYAQSDQSICLSLEYSMTATDWTSFAVSKLKKEAAQARLSQRSNCWKSHATAHMHSSIYTSTSTKRSCWRTQQREKVNNRVKIRIRYSQAPHLTQDTDRKVTTSQPDITNESQEGNPFPAVKHKAPVHRSARKHSKNKTETTQMIHKRSTAHERSIKLFYWRA